MPSGKKIDLLFIILWTIPTTYIYANSTYRFLGGSLDLSIFAFLIPIIYMSIRKRKNWKKLGKGIFFIALIFTFFLEVYAAATGAWVCPKGYIPIKFNTGYVFDCALSNFLMTALVLIFYEHFIDKEVTKKISTKYKDLLIIATILLLMGVSILIFSIDLSTLPYPYFIIGSFAIIPLAYLIFTKPVILPKLLMNIAYFFAYFSLMILPGVYLGYWSYPGGEYIGMVNVFGITYPYEEIIFWMLLYPATIPAYYEIFIDDSK